MKIIAAFGQLMAGKDTFCDFLAANLNKHASDSTKWGRNAFANAVKDLFCTSFDVNREFIENWKRNPEPPPGMLMPVRQGLQMIGDGFRKIKPDIWIDIALRKTEKQILSDGRYINEAKAVREKKGLNILIYREGYINDDPNPSESQIRPVIEFCKNNMQAGVIKHSAYPNAPEELRYFDVFLENRGDVSSFLDKSYAIVVASMFNIMSQNYTF
jgi:hypothetical protein